MVEIGKKVLVIYHSIDLDGWFSAAIVREYFERTNSESCIISSEENIELMNANIFASPCIDFVGYNHGDNLPQISDFFDTVIMCDISFPPEEMLKLKERFGDKFIWLDHHISSINKNKHIQIEGVRDVKRSACQITWDYFNTNVKTPELVRLIGIFDCFSSKYTDEHTKAIAFNYGVQSHISNYIDAYKHLKDAIHRSSCGFYSADDEVDGIMKDGWAIYNYLCIKAKGAYKNGFPLVFTVDSENIYKFIAINSERTNLGNFGIDYHSDGYDGVASFWFDGNNYNFSLYNLNELVDCSKIAAIYGGGGHFSASGFIVKSLNEIK